MRAAAARREEAAATTALPPCRCRSASANGLASAPVGLCYWPLRRRDGAMLDCVTALSRRLTLICMVSTSISLLHWGFRTAAQPNDRGSIFSTIPAASRTTTQPRPASS